MVQAATRGVIDFRDVKLHDPRWWQRMRILLRQVELDSYLRKLESLQQHNLLTLVVPNLKEEVFEIARDETARIGQGIHNVLFPWDKQAADEKPTGQIADMRQAWVDVWGDPDDPEVQKRIQDTVDLLTGKKAE